MHQVLSIPARRASNHSGCWVEAIYMESASVGSACWMRDIYILFKSNNTWYMVWCPTRAAASAPTQCAFNEAYRHIYGLSAPLLLFPWKCDDGVLVVLRMLSIDVSACMSGLIRRNYTPDVLANCTATESGVLFMSDWRCSRECLFQRAVGTVGGEDKLLGIAPKDTGQALWSRGEARLRVILIIGELFFSKFTTFFSRNFSIFHIFLFFF